MATNKVPGILSGPYGSETIVVNKIVSAAVNMGAVVKDATAGTGEFDMRVAHATATTDVLRGVVVGGDNRGTYNAAGNTTGTDATKRGATAAGQGVQVATFGRVLVLVNGSVATITAGDALTADPSNAGYVVKAAAGGWVIGHALQGSTLFGDYILADIAKEGIL